MLEEANTSTISLEDGTLVSIKGSRGIITSIDEGRRFYVKDGENLDVTVGNDHLFDDMGEVVIGGEGIIVKHEDATLFTQKGDATCYRSDNVPWYKDKEVLMHGWQIHAIVGDKSILVASFSDRYEACAGTVSGGGFRFVGGVEYELF